MSQRDLSEVEPESTSELPAASRALFLEVVRQSNAACQARDFGKAVALYSEALQLDPNNHVLYSNRSAARLKMGQFSAALQDAVRARDLNPHWPKAYYRQGVALQCLGRHGEALAALSAGLAQDAKSSQLLSAIMECTIKSPLRGKLEPTFQQLEEMNLETSPFVVISVVGQELLAAGLYSSAVVVLESALQIGTCSLKLRGSVFSALSSAYWALNSLEKAINYMQQDLAVAKSLGDIAGECRAHGNLGSAYFSQGSFKEALTCHRYQLVLAMKCKDSQAAAAALTSLGHVYTAIGDYPNALASHKQCVQLVKQMGDRLQEAREIGNVGAVYLAMGEFESAVDCHTQHLRLARRLNNKVEEARAYSNLGSSHHYRRNFAQAIAFHENVLHIAQELGDRSIEARAYAGLGHAARCAGDYQQAKHWHERQLDMALSTRDKMGEGRACSNLGIVYQLLGEHDAALKLHQAHLSMARLLQDKAGMGRAYGNIGNAYSAMGYYEQAIKYHKQELTISKEVNDRSSEASTHGNLAVAYQALGAHEMALSHYKSHLNIARELKDSAGEACALLNLGNCLSSRAEFAQAVPYYDNYLMLSQELHDIEGEAKACHFLGYAHYCLGNYREAVRYYDQDLALAKDLQDKMNMGRAYCNLGLAHLALGNLDGALECQKYFLAIAHMLKHLPGKFRALGNIGDVLIRKNDIQEANKMYQRQLAIARQGEDRGLEAAAYGALGLGHRLLRCFDKALGYHTQELTLRQEMSDLKGESRAHGHLGAVHMSLGNYTNAIKCYQEQLDRAKELKDSYVEAQAFGNLGIARLNMGHYEDAIGYLEQQLATLQQISAPTALLDKGRAFGNLGDCYDALGDHEEAVKCHEQHLAIALKLKSPRDQERAYCGLGHSHKCLGNLQQALVCHEKRLVVAHELNSDEAKGAAYGELGHIHSKLGNYDQAISCLEHQLSIATQLKDRIVESEAACGLGQVYQLMAEYTTALRYHQLDLGIAEDLGLAPLQSRACANLGAVHEALGNLQEAIRYQEQNLSVAAETNDKLAKTIAYSSLGRIHHTLGNLTQAISYLQQGLQMAGLIGRREEEAQIRHRLGLALWKHGDLEGAQIQLERAAHILEAIRRETRPGPAPVSTPILVHNKTSLFELQKASYQALQRVLVGRGLHEEALIVAERGRTRPLIDILQQRLESDGSQNQDLKGPTIVGSVSSVIQALSTKSIALKEESVPPTADQLVDIVNRQKACVLYYSLAGNFLYSWFIVPGKGIMRFHEVAIREEGNDQDMCSSSESKLEQLIKNVRESLGLQLHATSPSSSQDDIDTESVDMWLQPLEDIGDRASFLRMVNRNHLFNSSNYSLSSLFSVGSVGGSVASGPVGSGSISRPGSTRPRRPSTQQWTGPTSLAALYDLLIAPFEDCLPTSVAKGSELFCSVSASSAHARAQKPTRSRTTLYMRRKKQMTVCSGPCARGSGRRELLLVLEGDLYLVPFPLLKANPSPCDDEAEDDDGEEDSSPSEFLCERFSLLSVPSLTAIKSNQRAARAAAHAASSAVDAQAANGQGGSSSSNMSALVVGNPRLPSCISSQWGWKDLPQAEQEASMVADMLQAKALVGSQASKEAVLHRIGEAECVHLATHVSWKLSAIVLSPGEVVDSQSSKPGSGVRYFNGQTNSAGAEIVHDPVDDDGSELSATLEVPPLSEFLLTASDLLSIRLAARLVVISSSHTRDSHGWASADGILSLTRAILAAGAQCVLVSLWPVPDTATKILLRAFYSALLQGSRVSRALSEAMQTVQHTKHFAHPANWAGFVLVGSDVRLSNKVALMGQALCELLKTPEKCRDALRVTLHLVEKSLQRIHRGQKNAMYTTQKSIENKVGPVSGWKDLLMSVGFRFEPAANGIPSSVFFPQSDPEERLTQCSASLQALLGLTATSLSALSKLLANTEVADDIISIVRQVISQFSLKNVETESIEVPIGVKLWRVPGCHELLASLGFDLMEVGADEVTLRTGKLANRRSIQFVLQALLALFDTQEAPKNLSLDSSSSIESLNSVAHDSEDIPLDGSLATVVPPDLLEPTLRPPLIPTRPRPLPPPGHRSTITAFTSYVRRRGEPDGRTSSVGEASGIASFVKMQAAASVVSTPSNSRLLIGRAGGGGESDAAFTPSPPVSIQQPADSGSGPVPTTPSAPSSAAVSSTHRIRGRYGSPPMSESGGMAASGRCRPDSSSSASSATDWEGSGHNTVLRRVSSISAANHPLPPLPPLPPIPASRQPPAPPMVDSLHPLPPLMYTSNNIQFECNPKVDPDWKSRRPVAPKTPRPPHPPDRLSVRTEVAPVPPRKPIHPLSTLQTEPSEDIAPSALFFQNRPPADLPTSQPSQAEPKRPNGGLQEQIMATQLRRLNRELTPTISDVYHERNLGLGLAPPLTQLLTAHNLQESLSVGDPAIDKFGLLTTVCEENFSLGNKSSDESPSAKPWLSSAALQRLYHSEGCDSATDRESKARSSGSPCSELSRRERDEGDGRSIADSQCSAGSYKPATHRGPEQSKEAPPLPPPPQGIRSLKQHPPPPPPPTLSRLAQ